MNLVLFDIDMTLINTGEAGLRSLNRAFYEMFSIRDAFAGIETAGKTDIQIMKEGLSVHGLPSGDGILSSIVSGYIRSLKTEINNPRKYIQPGVVELLNALIEIDGLWLGLLTGNLEQGARIKLGALGLSDYVPCGAFGDDNEDRDKLLPIAVEKFKGLMNMDIHYHDCIVVGDTPRDVQCAKLFGAISIAVSTGTYHYESLMETDADYVLKDLSGALDVMKASIRK
ncbi:MAG: HAD family hydrolase [Pseudomonadota bacterium]